MLREVLTTSFEFCPLDLGVLGGCYAGAVGQLFDGEVAEEERGLVPQNLQYGEGEAAYLPVGVGGAAHLDEVAPRPHVGGHEDLGLGRVREDCPGRLPDGLPAVPGGCEHVLRDALDFDLLGDALLERVHKLPVTLGRLLERLLQGGLGALAATFANRRRHDEGAVGLVDEPLRPLAVGEPGPVPDQLVGQAPGHAGDDEPVVDVLEYAAIPLGQQVGDEVLDVPAAPSEAHVA